MDAPTKKQRERYERPAGYEKAALQNTQLWPSVYDAQSSFAGKP
jgi:hypothetical protein